MANMRVEQLFIAPDHKFVGYHGQPAGKHPISQVEQLECMAGRGVGGDGFFDFKEDCKGQITVFAMEVVAALRFEPNLPDVQPQTPRRNAFVRGMDLSSLIGRQFELQGVRLADAKEGKPRHGMNSAFGPGAEERLRGRAGLRCRIMTSGVLRRDS